MWVRFEERIVMMAAAAPVEAEQWAAFETARRPGHEHDVDRERHHRLVGLVPGRIGCAAQAGPER
jgi:hypothetical protein